MVKDTLARKDPRLRQGRAVRAGGQHRCRKVRPPPPSAGAAQAAGKTAAAATGSAKRTRAARGSRAGRRHVPCCGRRARSPSRERGWGRRRGDAGRRRALGPQNLDRASAAVSASGASNTSGLNFPAPGPANTRSRTDTRAPAEPLRGKPSGPGASAAASSALPGSHWRGGSGAIYLFPPPRSVPAPPARARARAPPPPLGPRGRPPGLRLQRGGDARGPGMRAGRAVGEGEGARLRVGGEGREAEAARGERAAKAARRLPGPSPCAPGRRLCCPPRGWLQPRGDAATCHRRPARGAASRPFLSGGLNAAQWGFALPTVLAQDRRESRRPPRWGGGLSPGRKRRAGSGPQAPRALWDAPPRAPSAHASAAAAVRPQMSSQTSAGRWCHRFSSDGLPGTQNWRRDDLRAGRPHPPHSASAPGWKVPGSGSVKSVFHLRLPDPTSERLLQPKPLPGFPWGKAGFCFWFKGSWFELWKGGKKLKASNSRIELDK